ncbi:mitochondrial matrix iron-sulfur protein [Savitreella phatthalungensis]
MAFLRPHLQSIHPQSPFSASSINQCRNLTTTHTLRHKHIDKPAAGEEIRVTFILQNGKKQTVDAPKGASILDVAHENDIDLEGACEGSVACSTCHVVVEPSYYDKLEEPTDEENDMLDLAFGLEETSRLGCQVELSKDLDGITVKLPSATRNMQFKN